MRKSPAFLDPKETALKRARQLKSYTMPFKSQSSNITNGINMHPEALHRKNRIMHILGANEQQWHNWKWQLQNRIRDVTTLGLILELNDLDLKRIEQVGQHTVGPSHPII
jgi:lysine 2,3-aminomutase